MDVGLKPSARGIKYVIVAWVLIALYCTLLTSAAETILEFVPSVLEDSYLRHIAIFIYALAVVSFLGGSQVPAVCLRKKSFIVQFVFSAIFGLILLLITVFNSTVLDSFNGAVLKPFFRSYPIIALEYLAIPYIFMIYLDLYLGGRLNEFSWNHFSQYVKGTFFRPRSTFEELILHRSAAFSFAAVVLVSLAWIVRIAVFSETSFIPGRWVYFTFNIGEHLNQVSLMALVVPALLLFWLTMSGLSHLVGQRLDCIGCFSDAASLLGFCLLPSSMVVLADLIEFGLGTTLIVPSMILLIVGFFIPAVVWPLILTVIAIKISRGLSWRSSSLVATVAFLPLFILLTRVFL